jgi:hypothetical protein
MHRLTTRAAIMLLIATFAAGCDASTGTLAQSFTHTGTPAASAVAVSSADGADGAAGQSISSSSHAGTGELPAEWPPDIVMPPASHIGATTSIVTGDTTTLSVSGAVGLPAHVVRDHFEAEFAGWEQDEAGWHNGLATWTLGTARARVLVGESGGQSGFTVRLD